MSKETFNYSEALLKLKQGKKVSSTRWGTEGKVYIILVNARIDTLNDQPSDLGTYSVMLLRDTTRNKTVSFTPSVENQFDDEWYIVE